MNNFDLKKKLANQNKQAIVTKMLGLTDKRMAIPFNQLELGQFKIYEIDETEVVDLAMSIATVGLEQNLVVKETDDPARYIIVTGHKRYSAIKYIIDNNVPINDKIRNTVETPMCVVIPKDEDELITRFRMHETNIHQRKGFTLSEVEDYINTIDEAKKRKIEVNGNRIVGTTRAILKTRFDLSEATAKKYIKIVKEGNQELKKAVDNGEISINNAYDVLMGTNEPIIKSNDEKKVEAVKKEFTIDDLKKSFKKIEKSLSNFDKDMKKINISNAEIVEDKLEKLKIILNEVEQMIKIEE